jgi:hypothetical protein
LEAGAIEKKPGWPLFALAMNALVSPAVSREIPEHRGEHVARLAILCQLRR